MSESMVSHKGPANEPKARANVHVPRLKSPRLSRPYFSDWVLQHQIAIASILILGVVSLHTFHCPSRAYTRKFLQLSYASQPDQTYKQGFDDLYFVIAWIVNFTALRAISIDWILRPAAKYLGVAKKSHLRFAEQGWLVLYYGTFWTLGMYLWVNSPYWLNNQAIWVNWPANQMSGTFKLYYLVQLAFSLQQILVIHIEARRKDHAQMLTHHIITCTLVSIAYIYRYTHVANVVLCLMDVVDVMLPIAKMLRYLRHETACNAAFGLFVITWLITRHLMYLQLCYDIYMDVPGPSTMLYGCYSGGTNELLPDVPAHPDYFSHLVWPFQDSEGPICLNQEVKWIFLGMLGLLQVLNLIWFGTILRVIATILMGGKPEDTRSDDEVDVDNGDAEMKSRPTDVTDLNVCVSSSSEYDKGREHSTLLAPKPTSTTARRRLMDVENRKELLARIGCEKPL